MVYDPLLCQQHRQKGNLSPTIHRMLMDKRGRTYSVCGLCPDYPQVILDSCYLIIKFTNTKCHPFKSSKILQEEKPVDPRLDRIDIGIGKKVIHLPLPGFKVTPPPVASLEIIRIQGYIHFSIHECILMIVLSSF